MVHREREEYRLEDLLLGNLHTWLDQSRAVEYDDPPVNEAHVSC